VKPKAPHIPWGRKRIRVKVKTSETSERRQLKSCCRIYSGVKFEDAISALLKTPPPLVSKKMKFEK
jgi:hypothetical protein